VVVELTIVLGVEIVDEVEVTSDVDIFEIEIVEVGIPLTAVVAAVRDEMLGKDLADPERNLCLISSVPMFPLPSL